MGFSAESYFHGLLPVFSHDEDDLESFRFITSQLVVSGNVKQKQIVKAFGISEISVKRDGRRFRIAGTLYVDVLNSTETMFPGTNLRLVYDLVSNQIPTGQEF